MLTTIIVCFCLTITVHADSQESSSNSTSTLAPNTLKNITGPLCDKDAELAKISCLSSSDHEEIWNGILKHGLARVINRLLIERSIILIGKEELRKALKLPPPPPWVPDNYTDPSDAEIASAQTLEAYYDLKEPRERVHSLDSYYFYEHNFPPVIAFLDKRVPVIRSIYKCKFEEIRSLDVAKVTDRQKIDRMISELNAICPQLEQATRPMFSIRCPVD
ncbi:unnamed protein product [Auanema sp. JU1783]|nr:unnamed protein product [Auanema sp. JU1783]